MFILPIGTKSSLALKPKVTLTLIGLNVLVGLITFPLDHQAQKKLFPVQAERYATQLRLYHAEEQRALGYNPEPQLDLALADIAHSADYYELEVNVMEAASVLEISFEDLRAHEKDLEAREPPPYEILIDPVDELLDKWQGAWAREQDIMYSTPAHALGLVPAKMGRPHTFITTQFVHGGILHLLGNLLFLWLVGGLLEDTWGKIPFLAFYLVGGVIAGLAHCMLDTSSTIPLIGASGAIAAAMGAFTIRHFKTPIRLFYFFILFFRPFWGGFYVPAFVFLPLWALEQVWMQYLTGIAGTSDVAYMAHTGGYAFGLVTAMSVGAFGLERKYIAPRVAKTQIDAGVLRDPRFEKAWNALDSGESEKAKQMFAKLVREKPHDLNLLQDVGMVYKEKGMWEDYGSIAGRSLKSLVMKSRYEEAATMALEIIQAETSVEVNPQAMLRVGRWLADHGEPGKAHDVYYAVVEQEGPPEVAAKAHIALAQLMATKLGRVNDALTLLEDAQKLPLDAHWQQRFREQAEAIQAANQPQTSVGT